MINLAYSQTLNAIGQFGEQIFIDGVRGAETGNETGSTKIDKCLINNFSGVRSSQICLMKYENILTELTFIEVPSQIKESNEIKQPVADLREVFSKFKSPYESPTRNCYNFRFSTEELFEKGMHQESQRKRVNK